MPKYAIEQAFNESMPVERVSYDPNKLNLLGKHLNVYNLGSSAEDKFLSPKLTRVLRFSDISGATGIGSGIHVLEYGEKMHYIFLATAPSAAVTRPFAVFTYNKETEEIGGGGLNIITFPTTTNHTTRGIRPSLQFYTVGTVQVTGSTVTGSGTSWVTDGICVGSRIGFGSTNSQEITTWYEIQQVDSETQITVLGSVGSLSGNTPYVIEDLRLAIVTTNATVVNGGMFLVKGLRLDSLTGGITIPAATTVDNIRACYRLIDQSVNTFTLSCGVTSGEFNSWQQEYMYAINRSTTTALKFYKINIRAPLTLTSGTAILSDNDMIITEDQIVSGGIIQLNSNGRYAVAQHGAGANRPSIYICCTNRVVRADVEDITSGSTSFLRDQMIESPPGGILNLPLTAGLLFADYSPTLDKFIISAYTAPNGRIYVTDYKTDGSQMDLSMGLVWNSFDSLSSTNVPFPSLQAQARVIWAEDGILYMINYGTSPTGQGYIYPAFAAHWSFIEETDNLAIAPKITLTGIPTRFNRVYVNDVAFLEAGNENDKTPEPYQVYYRTEGIDDNSGEWTLVPNGMNLRSVEPTNEIQFGIAFRTMGDICIPARITSLALIYEAADALPDEYQWNLGDSNIIDGTFGFTQINVFTEWPLIHTMRIFRADNNTLALEQTSDSTTLGEFEYWNGSTWVAGLGPNTAGTRRRFRPTSSLPGGVDLYAILTVDVAPE
jgi:hypothetical protein